jgi:hypothetical protein
VLSLQGGVFHSYPFTPVLRDITTRKFMIRRPGRNEIS